MPVKEFIVINTLMEDEPPSHKRISPDRELQHLLENGWRVTGHYTKFFSHKKCNGGIVLVYQEHALKIQRKWDNGTTNT